MYKCTDVPWSKYGIILFDSVKKVIIIEDMQPYLC